MMRAARPALVLCLAALLPAGAFAQETGGTDGEMVEIPVDPSAPSTLPEVNAPPVRYVDATGGRLRVLDKLTGTTTDLDLQLGAAQVVGKLGVVMDDCRYPSENPASESYAHLVITDAGVDKPVFQGWMIASSPALSALDHPRYDVWVLSCILPEVATEPVEGE
jgi:hypothetical protein